MYIANITAKFGSFHYAENETAFNPAMLEQYKRDAIPGAFAPARHMIDIGSTILKSQPTGSAKRKGDNLEPEPEIEENGSRNCKRKPSDSKKNDTVLVGSSEPPAKNARTTVGTEVQPAKQSQSSDTNLESTEDVDSKPIIPKEEPIEEGITDFDEYLPNHAGSFGPNQKCAQLCEELDYTASNLLHDLISKHKSEMVEAFNKEISTIKNALEQEVEALKKECNEKINEATLQAQAARLQAAMDQAEARAQVKVARAEVEAMKKEHRQKMAEAENKIKLAARKIESMKSTLQKALDI